MSSTNRGYDRHKSDYYITPTQPIKDFLKAFILAEQIQHPHELTWLDPCAGGDMIHLPAYPTAIYEYCNIKPHTIDIREDSKAYTKTDYLTHELEYTPEIIITNPPFHLALPIIEKAIEDVEHGGYVCMLLRLNFWGSKSRQPFFKKYPPKYCFIHPRRMSFTEDGKTDSIEYAHFVWEKGLHPKYTNTALLD